MKLWSKNSLAYKTAVLTCSNLILQAMGFVYRMALTAYAGAEALGLNALVMQVYQVAVSVCMSGLCVAVTSVAAEADSPAAIRSLLKRSAVIFIVLWTAMAAPIFLLRRNIAAGALGDESAHSTLALMLVCILMTGFENILKSIHMGAGRVRQCAASELFEQGIRFILVILLLKNVQRDVVSQTVFLIMLGMVFSEFFSVSFLLSSFCLCFIRGKMGGRRDVRYSSILRIALPSTITALSGTVFASAGSLLLPSRLMLAGLTRTDALSIIGILSTVAVPITLLPMAAVSALSSVSMPAITKCHFSGDSARTVRIAHRMTEITGMGAVTATAAVIPFAPLISQTLFGMTTEPVVFLLLGVKAMVVYYQVASVAILNGIMRQRTVLTFAAAGEAFQLVLIVLLSSVPALNIYGYLIAMITGELLRLVCNLAAIDEGLGVPAITPKTALKTAFAAATAYSASQICLIAVEKILEI